MNEIIKAMEERRSIRKFKADMPSKADIEQILEAGTYAASGMGKQGVITIAVTIRKSAISSLWTTAGLEAGRKASTPSTGRLSL